MNIYTIFKISIIIITIAICISIPIHTPSPDLEIQQEQLIDISKSPPKKVRRIQYISRNTFYSHIAKTESKGSYSIANRSLLLGKYQASKHALLEFGYSSDRIDQIYATVDTTYTTQGNPRYNFDITLFPPEEQERFIRWYMQQMETKHLRKHIHKYSGKTIQNIHITKTGILYASMMGYAHVQRFLESEGKYNYYAGSGKSIAGRLKKYANIEFSN